MGGFCCSALLIGFVGVFPGGTYVGGGGCFSGAVSCVGPLATVVGLTSVTVFFTLFVAIFDKTFDTAELPDCTADFKASLRLDKKPPSLPTSPEGFSGGWRVFPG